MTRTIQLCIHVQLWDNSHVHICTIYMRTLARVDHGRSVAYIRYICGCDLWDHASLLQHVCLVLQLICLSSSWSLFLRGTIELFPAIQDTNITCPRRGIISILRLLNLFRFFTYINCFLLPFSFNYLSIRDTLLSKREQCNSTLL